MATLAEAIKDRKNFSDDTKFTAQNGFETTLGELRAFQEATGRDVAKELETERQKLADEKAVLAKAQEEVVNLYNQLQGKQTPTPPPPPAGTDWTKDPFFAPIAEHLDKNVMAKLNELTNNYSQVQKALALGVKYITDNFSEMRYNALPEDFRKEVSYDAAVKAAAEKKYLDNGGVPDIRKVHEEWRTPRDRKAYEEKVQKDAYEKARQDLMSSSLARPSGMPVGVAPVNDPNAPKSMRESFQRLKEDPQFLSDIYKLTGQA